MLWGKLMTRFGFFRKKKKKTTNFVHKYIL